MRFKSCLVAAVTISSVHLPRPEVTPCRPTSYPGPDHPTVRWRECDLELAIVKDLDSQRFPTPELAAWFRESFTQAFADVATAKQRQLATLTKRKLELAAMQDRLLNVYLAGTIDDATYTAKSDELKGEAAKAEETIERLNGDAPIDAALSDRTVIDGILKDLSAQKGGFRDLVRAVVLSECFSKN